MHHHLKASGETCHWGFFDATLKPVLTDFLHGVDELAVPVGLVVPVLLVGPVLPIGTEVAEFGEIIVCAESPPPPPQDVSETATTSIDRRDATVRAALRGSSVRTFIRITNLGNV